MKKKKCNANCDRQGKTISKQALKKVKHFITKPKKIGVKVNNRKLFSLQHQTLSILRKADKFVMKQKSSALGDVNNIVEQMSRHEDRVLTHLKHNDKISHDVSAFQSHHASESYPGESIEGVSNGNTENDCNLKNNFDRLEKGKFKVNKKEIKIKKEPLRLESKENLVSENISVDRGSEDTSTKVIDENDSFDQKLKKLSKKQKEVHKKVCISKAKDICRKTNAINGAEERLISNNFNVDFYQFSKINVLLTLCHPCSLCFIGVLEIQVLIGAVNVLGYSLNKSSGKNTVFSPKGLSNLCIKTEQNGEFDDSVVQALFRCGIPKEKIYSLKKRFTENVVLLNLSRDSSGISSVIWPQFVEKYSDHSLLPYRSVNVIEDTLLSCFQRYSESSSKLFTEMPQWDSIFDIVKSGIHRTIVCGGKGVGKSTLLRYLINRSLSIWNKVLVIDFDPGQSEFMVPGCISAFLVTAPLLGPNFTHILDPLRSVFYGLIDVVQGLKHYFNCVQNVVDYCNSKDELKEIPWFVNTLGFSKGIGVLITSSVIKKISPTVLIQIESEDKRCNYPSLLNPEFIEKNILNLCRCVSDPETVNYHCITTESAIKHIKATKGNRKKEANIWGLAAPSMRKIMILSYFGQLLNSKVKDIFEVKPYVVNISDIHVKVMLKDNLTEEAVLDIINGNLVALCNTSEEHNGISTCLGFGIVRAIDKEKRQLFLLTPLKEDKLCHVNSLIKGSLSLPDKLYFEPPDKVVGHVPYITVTDNVLSSVVKKTFKNAPN